jgi:hypothetical protein
MLFDELVAIHYVEEEYPSRPTSRLPIVTCEGMFTFANGFSKDVLLIVESEDPASKFVEGRQPTKDFNNREVVDRAFEWL